MQKIKIEKWIGVEFESSSTKTQQFLEFAKDLKSYIKSVLPRGYSIAAFSIGHFYVSGFIKNPDGKFIYFSISDVRGSEDWYKNLLLRTATSTKDFTGGRNQYASLEAFPEKITSI